MNWGARPKLAGAAIGLAVALALSPMGPSLAQTPTPTPTPTPTNTASPSPTPTPTVSPEPTSTPRPSPSPTPRRGGGDDGKKDPPRRKEPRRGGDTPGDESARRRAEKKDSKDKKRKAERDRRKRKKRKDRKDAVSLPAGPFHTQRLVTRERKLRALGWTRRRIIAKVYAPFIVAGPAAWTDTWGAPRYGPAPGQLRGHEGQDVFCRRGDPVLAAEAGTIEFDEGGLGGKVARLHRRWGGYWYYAHLSDWNTKRFSSGDRVEVGDVIGFCGASGNARGTSPHVHFGLYRKNGRASDPMRFLVEWLRTATRGARGKVERAGAGRLSELNAVTSARLFGDAFTPDLSELDGARRPSWALARNPAADALGLAEIALEAAFGDHPGRAASLAKFLDMQRPSR